MILNLIVHGKNEKAEKTYVEELTQAVDEVYEARVMGAREGGDQGQIIFVDSHREDLIPYLGSIHRKGRAIFLIVDEDQEMPEAFLEGKADDVLVHPFRPIELLGKIYRYQQILMWDELTSLNSSFYDILQQLKDDVKLAERIQKGKLPVRFTDVKSFKVAQRYLAGMKSGGDHFDLAESKEGNILSFLLADSSSYGLSSALLSVLVRVTLKLSSEGLRSCSETVKKIYDELLVTLSEKDRLSLFYGVLSRKDYRLEYLNLGSSSAYYAPRTKPFAALATQGEALGRGKEPVWGKQSEITLEPESRFVLVSDGFTEALGGGDEVLKLLNELRDRDATDTSNELVYRVKSQLTEEEDMPSQDCTAILFDRSIEDGRVLHLTPKAKV